MAKENQNLEETLENDGASAQTAPTEEQPLTVEALQQKLAEEQKKSQEYMDNWQRSRADFINFKRRTENERATLSDEAKEKLLRKVLPIVDDFERAMQTMPEELKEQPWVKGVSMIEKKIQTFLDQERLSEIPAKDQEFNPHFHEAVQTDEDSTGDKDVVVEVYQKGYKLGDKVIRPAIVKVAKR